MRHITANTARQQFDGLLANVIKGSDPVSIATDEGAAILVNAEEWRELERLRHNAEYLTMIDKSAKQALEGRIVVKSIEELEELAT